ncbi:uncharacterized protein [Parasteatoda tepidariorum]|uniref:uncharacterized protein n=1 Tax=Parasteatoda tepidariorum TaxID=114398 RepID=UPI001C727646|nr:uncharacterized protein LOC107455681 [Parasteatoda tepidariorum]
MLINILFTAAVLNIVRGINLPSDPVDVGDGEHFKSCAIWIKCISKDQDMNDKLDSCTMMVPEEYGVNAVKHFADFSSMDWSWENREAFYQDFCAMDDEKQDEIFTEMVQYAIEVGISTCADPTKSEACHGIQNASSCATDIFNRIHFEGKC